jgi:hypothetical protein
MPENFSERVVLFCEIALQVSCHGVTSSGASGSGHRSTVRRECRRADHQLEKKRFPRGQRVLDGLPGVRAKEWVELQSRMSDTVPIKICLSIAAMVP